MIYTACLCSCLPSIQMTGARPIRQSTYRRDFKWHCPAKKQQAPAPPPGPSCSDACPTASVGAAPTAVDYCVCNQPHAYLRKDTMTTTYQAEVSALAELLKSAYSSMQPCDLANEVELQPVPPPVACAQPYLDWAALSTVPTCSGSPYVAPRVLRQLPIPPCRQHLPLCPTFARAPPACTAPQRLTANAAPAGATYRVLLGAEGPASPVYSLGYTEYQEGVDALGERILLENVPTRCGVGCGG